MGMDAGQSLECAEILVDVAAAICGAPVRSSHW
jgi:hypothetical protein